MEHDSFWGNPRTWVGVAFVIFLVLFGRTLWRALTAILDKRAEQVRAELAEAARLRSEAERMLHEAETMRDTAVRDAAALLEGARTEAARLAAAAATEAEAAARRRERMALERIAAAEKAAVGEVRITAAEVATAAAREVIAGGLTEAADAALIDRAIAGLPAALSPRRAA